ncbi:MAG: ribbon-helix-helix protein, CopG family [Gammaproteobacteria bacterium]|nr:MAG: ribbon-helix-helix protein, CopG family [Gammaproteobacteria bacterium]
MRNTQQPMRVVSIKLPVELDRELSELARKRRSTRSAVVRNALQALVHNPRRSVTSTAGNLVGCLQGAPRDLATARRHLADYGR